MRKQHLQHFILLLLINGFQYLNAQDVPFDDNQGIHFVNNAASDSSVVTINNIPDSIRSENDSDVLIVPATKIPSKKSKGELLAKAKEKGLSITGSFGFQLGYYAVSGIPKRMNPFTYQITGDVTFKYKDIIELPFSFVFSEHDRKFNQPFNQIGVSPKYKWLTVHGGFRNINWSENSMAGHNMLMVGAEVNPKFFRGGILFGRLNKVTLADTAKIDSLHLQTFIPTYKRLGMAVKLGAGTENNYVDLIYFRAWDKSKDSFFYSDDNGLKTLLPKSENAVFNILTSNKIGKHITIKADYALSTTNVDRTLPKNKDSANADYPKIAGILLKPNSSAIGGHSTSTDFQFQKDGWNTNVGFKLTTQNFNTFGAYYLQTNYYKVYARQSIPLQKQKASLTINADITDDNLNKKKPFATKRAMIQTGYDFNDTKFGITTQYILAYSKQKAITDSLKNSTFNDLLINQLNHTIILIPRYVIVRKNNTHLIILNELANFLTDLNKNTKDNADFFNNVINLSYTLNMPLKYFSLTGSVYNTYIKNKSLSLSSYGVSVTTNESFAKNKIMITDAAAVTFSKLATVVNFNLTVSYSPEKHHRLYLANSLIWNGSKISASPVFTELRGNFGYLYTF